MGIPCGNTVIFVGDPGTGKTTFLLLFFRQGNSREERMAIASSPIKISNPSERALNAFDELIPLSESKADFEGARVDDMPPTVRIFVSLDNSFESVCRTHNNLLPPCFEPNNEQWFFVDATSFLSGRLQDGLRYPKLGLLDSSPPDPWDPHEFTLGGWDTHSEAGAGWFWIAKDKPHPILINDLEDRLSPFMWNSKNHFRLLRLFTPTLYNPLVRSRLLKDLLAEIFAHAKPEKGVEPIRLLAVDSLTSLISKLPGSDHQETSQSSENRLQVLNLVRWLEELKVTTLFASEASHQTDTTLRGEPLFLGDLERYLASGVVQLDYHKYNSGDIIRYLRILKMRGARHDMRPYAYDLDQEGLSWLEPLIAETAPI